MRLQPNIGSDRSWVWKVAADVSEGTPTAETLAIRFANADSASNDSCKYIYISFLLFPNPSDAGQFKTAFEEAQRTNADLASTAVPAVVPTESEPTHAPAEETTEEPSADATATATGEPSATSDEAPAPEPVSAVETKTSEDEPSEEVKEEEKDETTPAVVKDADETPKTDTD